MEEIDKIILTTVNNLSKENGGVIPESVYSLKQFDTDMVATAISTCLENIIPSTKFPKKLPPSMALRLKTASFLAQEIKNLGYTNEIGYQSILYFNEIELRKLLVYLIERLPKQTKSPTSEIKDVGYVSQLLSEVEKKVTTQLTQMWVPLQYRNDCFISLPHSKKSLTRIPLSNKFNFKNHLKNLKINPPLLKASEIKIESLHPNYNADSNIIDFDFLSSGVEVCSNSKDDIENLTLEIQKQNNLHLSCLESVKEKNKILKDLIESKQKTEKSLQSVLETLKLKTRTVRLLEQDENLVKIKSLINEISERILELNKKWQILHTKLLDEYNKCKETNSESFTELRNEKQKLENISIQHKNLLQELKEKEELESFLYKKVEQIPKNNNRSFYTNNIYEIIKNIKKQNIEIQKILKDTKEVQRDINNLSGQIDRSFKESDELIFYNAKEDEIARTLYKLLATLRNECLDIVDIISNIGSIEREARSLQEQLDIESGKEINTKLKRIQEDLNHIKRETEKMLN